MDYIFDDFLDGHLKKAFVGALARMAAPAAKGAFNFGRGFLGLGGKGVMAGAGAVAGVAAPVAGAMMAQPSAQPKIAHPLIDAAAKVVLGSDLGYSPTHRAINAFSYGAFALPYLSKTVHDNHALSTALNAAGLLGLGGTSAHKMLHGDTPSGYDLAGLATMGAGMLHEHLHPQH